MPKIQRFLRVIRHATLFTGGLTAVMACRADAQAPASSKWLVRADWLQASSITLDRTTMPSIAAAIEWRKGAFAVEAGFLRAVRSLSTIQGGYAAIIRPVRLGPVIFLPGIGLFGGQSAASADTTGYEFLSGGVAGHQPRYSYSTGSAFGVGAQLGFAVPIGAWTEMRASVAEWSFSSDPVKGDNARFLAGVGFAVRVPGLGTRTPSTAGGK